MSKLVRLHRDTTVWPSVRRVVALPPWVRPSDGSLYWHRPRSAYYAPDDLTGMRILMWCGQTRHSLNPKIDLAFNPPEAALQCGTCVGRALGYIGKDGLVHRPRDPFKLPARCPIFDWDDASRCIGCGHRVLQHWNRSPRPHRPNPELAEWWSPCPGHGWRNMGSRDGQIVCKYWRCDYVSPDHRKIAITATGKAAVKTLPISDPPQE